jgi:4-amino-4-deoxychorismate lyase
MYWYAGVSIESQTIELDINDAGLLYGATVFTTFRTEGLVGLETRLSCPASMVGKPDRSEPLLGEVGFLLDLHCDRLRSSIEDLGWCQPDWEQIRSGVECLAPHFPVLRITIFPDGRELITGRDLPPNLATWQREGVTVIIADRKFTRSLPHHKTGNYLAPWLALQQARNNNIQEAILTNDRGDWLETTTGNLWGYRAGCWYTPPLSAGILPGMMRSQILHLLQAQHQPVIEIEWETSLVTDLEAIGYGNSVIHLIPIHTVLTPVGRLEYEAQHPMMQQLRHQLTVDSENRA